MIVSKLVCQLCNFESEAFHDATLDPSESEDIIIQNEKTLELKVLQSGEESNCSEYLEGSCRIVDKRIGEFDVEMDVSCPGCKGGRLMKHLIGFG